MRVAVVAAAAAVAAKAAAAAAAKAEAAAVAAGGPRAEPGCSLGYGRPLSGICAALSPTGAPEVTGAPEDEVRL